MLVFAIVICFVFCPVTVIIVVGMLGLFPSHSGTLLFIAVYLVYFVGGLNDLV